MLSAGCPYIHDLALHDESGQKQKPVRAELRREGPAPTFAWTTYFQPKRNS